MKYLLVASATPHSPMTHRLLAFGRELVKRGHTVVMLAPSSDKYSQFKPDCPADIDGIRIRYPFHFKTRVQPFDLLPYLFHAAILAFLSKPTITYINKATPASLPALVTKWLGRAKVVLDMDDLDAEVMQAQGQPAPVWMAVDASEKIIAANADAFVVVSRLLEREYRLRYPSTDIIRVPNGVNPKQFPPAKSAKRPARLIFFGILGRTSILEPVLKALPELKNQLGTGAVQLEILGDGPCRSDLEQLTRDLGLDDNVHFRGWVTYEQARSYMAAGDIGLSVMPNERTTAACSNQKVFQYMSLGLATIVSRVGDMPLYVGDGEAGVVVPSDDVPALVAALKTLLTDNKLRAAMAAQAKTRAVEHYSWSALAHKVVRLTEKLA